MREIKFRAWDGIRYKYLEDANFIIEYTGISTFNEFDSDRTSRDWVLEQYTGLKDKNGVEIYEGDILQCVYDDVYTIIPDNYIGIVEYFECGFYVTNRKNSAFHLFQEIAQWEVIGDIHQNPELLEANNG